MEQKTDQSEILETLRSGYKIIQGKNNFKFGIDAFLLAWFAKDGIRNGQSVADLCTGTGIVPILLAGASRAVHLTGLEIQEEQAQMAKRSVELNSLCEKIEIVQGDVKFIEKYLPQHSVNVVTCNPPYMIYGHGKHNPKDEKAIARFEVLCSLEDVVRAADFLLKDSGVFYMIHRPFRLAEIFKSLSAHKLEPKRILFVQPSAKKEPNLVLIEARKNANPRLSVEKPLIVYENPGEYSEEVQNIYKSL